MKVEKTQIQHRGYFRSLKYSFKKLLFNIYFWPLFILITLTGFLCIPFVLTLNSILHFSTSDKAFRKGIRIYGRIIIKAASIMVPVEVDYRSESLSLPAIFVANHRSSADPFLFGALPFENSFVTSWPFKIPFYRWAMKKAGYINSREGWENLVLKANNLFKRGSSLIIWPEGHRSTETELQRFRNGAFSLAVETGRPIVPVYIMGSGDLLPPGKKLLNPGPIKIIIFPEIPPEKYTAAPQPHKVMKADVRDLIEKAMETVKTVSK